MASRPTGRPPGRPKPDVLDSRTDSRYFALEILAAEAYWTVFYRGQPMSVRKRNTLVDFPGPKYCKTAFPNHGFAWLLCRRLRKIFRSNDFQVYRMTAEGFVREEDPDE